MLLEVIATTVEDIHIAEANGADRIELISGITEGGVTPSYALIRHAVKATKLPVNVMIRPHANHFCYSPADVEIMKEDIRHARELGAAGIVLGVLTPQGKVDTSVLESLLEEAGHCSVTFHRAIDEIDDQMEALQTLQKYSQIDRVLTSGGAEDIYQAGDQIKRMVEWSKTNTLKIMGGGGLRMRNLEPFIRETGMQEVHLGIGARIDENPLAPVDAEKVRTAADIIRRLSSNGMR